MNNKIKLFEKEIQEKKEFLAKQSSFYIQYEDMGQTQKEINALKRAIEIIKSC